MDTNNIWVQLLINILGGLLVALLLGLGIHRIFKSVLHRDKFFDFFAPIRRLYLRLQLRGTKLICVAANVADGHWDKYAASFIMDHLYGETQYFPVFLPPDEQEWTPFWEAIGSRSFSLLILGSQKRFGFTEYVLDQLKKLANPAGSLKLPKTLNLIKFKKETRLSIEPHYDDNAHIIVVKWLRLRDSFKFEHTFPRVILIMGESGPATLAACHAYLAQPKIFEPKNRLSARGSRRKKDRPTTGRISTLTVSVLYRKTDDNPQLYDYRYADHNSIKLIRQQDFATNHIEKEIEQERLLRPLGRKIQLPTGYDRDDWHYFSPRKFIVAVENLRKYRDDVPQGNRWLIRWGWKRDSDDGKYTRVVYLSAYLLFDGEDLVCVDPYFYLYHRGEKDIIDKMREKIKSIQSKEDISFPVSTEASRVDSTNSLRLQIGRPRDTDTKLLNRLKDRLPDPPQPKPLIQPSEVDDLLKYTPCDLYVGSGLSYEVGVPVMRSLHMMFHVDDGESTFKFANNDGLVDEIRDNWRETFKRLLSVDTKYILAQPGVSHKRIEQLQSSGFIRKVYSDNVDDLLERTGITPIQTRGPGLYNEKFDVTEESTEDRLSGKQVPYLWVVGVSADRREIIWQARQAGKKIVVINPDEPVSPRSKRLDYLQQGDVFIKKRFLDTIGKFNAESDDGELTDRKKNYSDPLGISGCKDGG